MSALVSTTGLWSNDKAVGLTTHTRHRHGPSPISLHFTAPNATPSLIFGPMALAAAVARTATTREARPRLLTGLQKSALAQLECLISDDPVFELSADFNDLADTERTLFAARVGAGITDLYMNALGYVWRANAACLSRTLDPHADFIYDGGNADGHGVVLAEAHGSFAAKATAKSVAAQAKRKYARQVKPYLAKTSPYGQVVHGYSIAFGSKPGTAGAFLSLAETRIPKPGKKSPPPPALQAPTGTGATPTMIALATHRSNFLLMGASQVVDWIDWVRTSGELPADRAPVTFLRFGYAGRWYLGSPSYVWPLFPRWWPDMYWDDPALWDWIEHDTLARRPRGGPPTGWFVMEETACVSFLDALSGMTRDGGERRPERLELPTFDPIGFGAGGDDRVLDAEHPDYDYALFRDGLALIDAPFRWTGRHIRRWLPKEGFERQA